VQWAGFNAGAKCNLFPVTTAAIDALGADDVENSCLGGHSSTLRCAFAAVSI
jgi:hypothetical protein